jgi:hypothetical protein
VTACDSTTAHTINTAGSYLVTADLQLRGTTWCFSILPSNIQLDCQGHKIPGIFVQSSNVSIANCNVNGGGADPQFAGPIPLRIVSSRSVTVANSTVSDAIDVAVSSSVVLMNDIVSGSLVGGLVVALDGGNHNQVLQCAIDGGWNGTTYNTQGADDGIFIQFESNDVIQGNTIRNVFDAGIEPLGQMTGTTIADNNITAAGVTGIGAYYGTAWQSDTIRGNTVSQTPQLFNIQYISDASRGATNAGSFQGNTITGNSLRSPTPFPPGFCPSCGGVPPNSALIELTRMTAGVSGNVLQGNDFGTRSAGPVVMPVSAFGDVGGNVCAQGGTLPCSSTGPSPASLPARFDLLPLPPHVRR